jgi:hypothetical protein
MNIFSEAEALLPQAFSALSHPRIVKNRKKADPPSAGA